METPRLSLLPLLDRLEPGRVWIVHWISEASEQIRHLAPLLQSPIRIPVWAIVVVVVALVSGPIIAVSIATGGSQSDTTVLTTGTVLESATEPASEELRSATVPMSRTPAPEIPMSQREAYARQQGADPADRDTRYAAEEVERLQAELEAIQRNSAMLRSLTRQQSGDLSLAYSSLEATQEQKEGALEDLQTRIDELETQIQTVDELARDLRRVLGMPEPSGGMGGPLGSTGVSDDSMDPWLRLRTDIVSIEQRAGSLVLDLDEVNTEIQLRVARVHQTGLPRGGSLYDDLEFYDRMPVGWPIEGPITSRFGMRTSPFSGEGGQEMHTGIDIAARTGTPVRATGGGTIQYSGDYGGYGLLVIVDHGRGITTWYGHNSRLLVSAGQRIEVGHVIAEVGSTGRSTGPHVHYEVRINGAVRDPLPLMQMSR